MLVSVTALRAASKFSTLRRPPIPTYAVEDNESPYVPITSEEVNITPVSVTEVNDSAKDPVAGDVDGQTVAPACLEASDHEDNTEVQSNASSVSLPLDGKDEHRIKEE